jgi:PTS system mannose-specific IIA component
MKMIGVVVVAHLNLGEELIRVINLIAGKRDNFHAVSFAPDEDPEEANRKVAAAVKRANTGDGVLILTDMFGGTPSNLSLSLLEEGKVEVVTGVNLPMLIKLASYTEVKNLPEIARELQSYGQKNIYLASEILKKKVDVKK